MGNGDEQVVAHLVPVEVVDLLEPVQVSEQDRGVGPGSCGSASGVLDPFVEEQPVG
jgi:hypothetical protein